VTQGRINPQKESNEITSSYLSFDVLCSIGIAQRVVSVFIRLGRRTELKIVQLNKQTKHCIQQAQTITEISTDIDSKD